MNSLQTLRYFFVKRHPGCFDPARYRPPSENELRHIEMERAKEAAQCAANQAPPPDPK